MPNTNASFSPRMRSTDLKAQIEKLEALNHHSPVRPSLERFDAETEDLLARYYGPGHRYVEAYKYATLGEAEAMVNLPESAQEPQSRDKPKTGVQQRRQTLLAVLTEMETLEQQETQALTGEDHEDPPSV